MLQDDDSEMEAKFCIICRKTTFEKLIEITHSNVDMLKGAAEKRRDNLKTDISMKCTNLILDTDTVIGEMYHRSCYKQFSAVRIYEKPSSSKHLAPLLTEETRSSSGMITTGKESTNLLDAVCIFCNRSRKQINKRDESLCKCKTEDGVARIKDDAKNSNNEHLIRLLDSGVDLIAQEAYYHKSCRKLFDKAVKNNKKEDASGSRTMHNVAFNRLEVELRKQIIECNTAMLLPQIYDLYKHIYVEAGGNLEDLTGYTNQSLKTKVMRAFNGELSEHMYDRRKGIFLFRSSIS